MEKFVFRYFMYFGVFVGLSYVLGTPNLNMLGIAMLALILVCINSVIRPILTLIALPLTILTLGVMSIFVNMFTIFIADAISPFIKFDGFWNNFLAAILIMVVDMIIRVYKDSKVE